jgi:hypothetical protein
MSRWIFMAMMASLIVVLGDAVVVGQSGTQREPANPCGKQPANSDPSVTPPRLTYSVPALAPFGPQPAFACVEAVVGTNGALADLKVVETSSTDMTTSALTAARGRRYAPALRDGKAIAYPIKITFTGSMNFRDNSPAPRARPPVS